MAKRTPTPDATDGPAVSKSICGRLDDHDGVRRVCVRDPHDGAYHNMQVVSPGLARALARRGVTGPVIQQLGTAPTGGWWDVPESPTDEVAMQTPATTETLPAVSPPDDVQAAGPAPTPDAPTASEPSGESTASPAGSGGGSGRPFTDMNVTKALAESVVEHIEHRYGGGRSIGTVLAHTAIDTALGVPAEVLDERAHGREATELLLETAAEHWRHDRLMPAELLLDLEAVVGHMVTARGLK